MIKDLFYIESLGCAKNQVESEKLLARLEKIGLSYTPEIEKANFIFINTCAFIKSAVEESIETIFSLKKTFPHKKLIICGCLPLRYREQIAKAIPEGHVLKAKIETKEFNKELIKAIGTKNISLSKISREKLLSYPGSVYLKIADGCNNHCSYCTIPYIRGKLKSRTQAEIIAEAKTYINKGFKELILIAQDTAAFGFDRGKAELADLLKKLNRLPGDFSIRLLYLHPDHAELDLIKTIIDSPKIIPYFDLPFQHASQKILKAMNRKKTAESYLRLVDFIRSFKPAAIIRTTFMVGFPGETQKDFNELLDFIKELKPNWAGFFCYSPEEKTSAFKLKDRVSVRTATQRLKKLQQIQQKITEEWLEGLLGQEIEVLIEELIPKENLALARAYFQAPEVDGLVLVKTNKVTLGDIIKVKLTRRNGIDLEGSCG